MFSVLRHLGLVYPLTSKSQTLPLHLLILGEALDLGTPGNVGVKLEARNRNRPQTHRHTLTHTHTHTHTHRAETENRGCFPLKKLNGPREGLGGSLLNTNQRAKDQHTFKESLQNKREIPPIYFSHVLKKESLKK